VNSYGGVLPFGGRLDPVTGAWSPLPDAPEAGSGGWPVEAVQGPVTAAEGWLYDDGEERWTMLPRPEGAPSEPGPATWLDDTLVVYGGSQWAGSDDRDLEQADQDQADQDQADVYSTHAWAYRPPH
jgi:hypothetical protein